MKERAAILFEYVIAFAVLVVILLGSMQALKESADDRSEQSISTATKMAPCNEEWISKFGEDSCL